MLDEQFDPRELFSEDVIDGMEVDVEWQDVEHPEEVPENDKEHEVKLANRILEYALPNLGHHESIRKSMEEWANEYDGHEDDPGYWRKMTFKIGPAERNLRGLEGDLNTQYKKARTVIAWASDEFQADDLRDIESKLTAEYAETWQEELAEFEKTRSGKNFLRNPPATVNGWKQLDVPGYGIGYYGCDETGETPRIVLLFEMDGHIRFWSVTPTDYATEIRHQNGLDTDDMFEYRDKRLTTPESWAEGGNQLKTHLESYRGDPVYRPYLPTLDQEGVGGRTGPYKKDKERIEPLNVELPGRWSLLENTIGGNSDVTTQWERVIWEHPYYGEIIVHGNKPVEAETWTFTTDFRRGIKTNEDCLLSEGSREQAYDAAIQWICAHPDPTDDLWEASRLIAVAFDEELEKDGSGDQHRIERIATQIAEMLDESGYEATEIEEALNAGCHNGGDEWSNLPTFLAIRDAGIVHPQMSENMAEKAKKNQQTVTDGGMSEHQASLGAFNR